MTTEVIDGGAPAGTTSETATTAAAQPNAATTDPATGAGKGGDEGQVAPKTFTQAELDEIVQKRIAKAEAKAERRVLRTLERVLPQQTAQPTHQEPADDGKPLRSQFQSEDEWLDARDTWRDRQRDTKEAQTRQGKEIETLASRTDAVWKEAEKVPGFDPDAVDDLAESGKLTPSMARALVELPGAAKVLAHLAANPADAERIAKLSPNRQAAELGKLEDKVSAAPPKSSRAPDPIDPTGSGKTSVVTDPSRMNPQQYREFRKSTGARWAQ